MRFNRPWGMVMLVVSGDWLRVIIWMSWISRGLTLSTMMLICRSMELARIGRRDRGRVIRSKGLV